jgi:hypothetical protein
MRSAAKMTVRLISGVEAERLMFADLDVKYRLIESTVHQGDGWLSFYLISGSPSEPEILIGVDRDMCRYVICELFDGDPTDEDRSGRVIQVVRAHLSGKDRLAVKCVDTSFNAVFTQFVTELVEPLKDSDRPAIVVRQSLERWRRMFEVGRGALSLEAQAGLFAELHQLARLLDLHGPSALDAWVGPNMATHDFRAAGVAIEVKGSVKKQGRRTSISSVEQLDPPVGVDLHLRYVSLALDATGESLPDCIDELIRAGVSATSLYEKLIEAGYSKVHEDQYRETRFLVKESLLYDVADIHFPKITSTSFEGHVGLPPGVAAVSYTIDLTNQPPIPLDKEAEVAVELRLGS